MTTNQNHEYWNVFENYIFVYIIVGMISLVDKKSKRV